MNNISKLSISQQFYTIDKTKDLNAVKDARIGKEKESKTEKFEDILKELRTNVPDRTTTIEEKELAISYIDRMLSCDDIPTDAKKFWINQKKIIQAEIIQIRNQSAGYGELYNDVMQELNAFVDDFRGDKTKKSFLTLNDRVNYWRTYNNTCISYYQRMLKCADITPEQRQYCLDQISYHKRDNNYGMIDLNNFNRMTGAKTESFQDVYSEFTKNIPDRTTTISEKELAISYIDRMLSCDDIPDNLITYWQNKKEIIEMEILNIKNSQALSTGGENFADVGREFNEFGRKYSHDLNQNLSPTDQKENRLTYYRTYLSFCERFLNCSDITEEQRASVLRMMENANREMGILNNIVE